MKLWVKYNKQIYGTKYSRMDQVKFVEDRKNLKGYGLPKVSS